MKLYRDQCAQSQERFLCHPNNAANALYKFKPKNPVGSEQVRKWIKEIADICKFTDFMKYAAHCNRHQMCTAVYSNPNITQSAKENQCRHKTEKSGKPYKHYNHFQNNQVQEAILGGLVGTAKLFRESDDKENALSATGVKNAKNQEKMCELVNTGDATFDTAPYPKEHNNLVIVPSSIAPITHESCIIHYQNGSEKKNHE